MNKGLIGTYHRNRRKKERKIQKKKKKNKKKGKKGKKGNRSFPFPFPFARSQFYSRKKWFPPRVPWSSFSIASSLFCCCSCCCIRRINNNNVSFFARKVRYGGRAGGGPSSGRRRRRCRRWVVPVVFGPVQQTQAHGGQQRQHPVRLFCRELRQGKHNLVQVPRELQGECHDTVAGPGPAPERELLDVEGHGQGGRAVRVGAHARVRGRDVLHHVQ